MQNHADCRLKLLQQSKMVFATDCATKHDRYRNDVFSTSV